MKKTDVGIIGAMQPEIEQLLSQMKKPKLKVISGILFYSGKLGKKKAVIAKCGIGKVFAALTAEAMILNYAPKLLINTGVGGALAPDLRQGDIVVAEKLVQHDMDTSAIGDPVGMISGIGKTFFEADAKAVRLLCEYAVKANLPLKKGTIASGDVFVASGDKKDRIRDLFGATVCEMEGAALAQVAFVNKTPFTVIRCVSDGADESAGESYEFFLPAAAKKSAEVAYQLAQQYSASRKKE